MSKYNLWYFFLIELGDLITTEIGLHQGLVESNPLYSTPLKVLSIGISLVLFNFLWFKKTTHYIVYALNVLLSAVVISNTYLLLFY